MDKKRSRRCCETGVRQLGLLLWKNSILKRRSHLGKTVPIFLLIEVLWPIILFAIIAGLRSQFPPEQIDTAVFQPFALPSAGVLPFLQSAICDFNGKPVTNHTDMPSYPNASVNQFYAQLEGTDLFTSWDGVCSDVEEKVVCLSAQVRLQSCQKQDPIQFNCTLRDPESFSHFLSHDLGLSQQTTHDITTAEFVSGDYSSLADLLNTRLTRRQAPPTFPTSPPTLPSIPPDLPTSLPPGFPTDIPSTLPTGLPPFFPTGLPEDLQGFGYLGEYVDYFLDGDTLRSLVCGDVDVLESGTVIIEHPETVRTELCALNDDQFQSLADELRDQMLNNCSLQAPEEMGQTVESLQRLVAQADRIRELVDTLPSFDNTSDTFENLELFLCGANRTDTGLGDVLRRFTQGDSYRRARTQQEADRETEDNSESGSGSGSGSGGGLGGGEGDSQLSPKIYFTPNTTCTQSIIRRANRTFAVAGILMRWSRSVADCTGYLLRNETQNTIISAVDLLVNITGDNETVVPGVNRTVDIGGDILGRDNLTDLQHSLDRSNPDNLWNTLQDVHDGAEQIEESIGAFDWNIFTPISSPEEMVERAEDYEWQDQNQISIVAGLVFDDIPEGEEGGGGGEACPGLTQPKLYIRMNSSITHDTTTFRQRVWRPGPEDGRENDFSLWKRVYLQFGFVFIQDMVERGIIEEILATALGSGPWDSSNTTTKPRDPVNSTTSTSWPGRLTLPGSYVEQMPYPCYSNDLFTESMEFVLPLAMIFAWLFPIAMTIRGIVREKETRLREFMKMMGLSDAVLRTSWFMTSGCLLFLSVIGITLLLKFGVILPYTNWLLIMLFILLFAISMIAYSFLVSIFFSNANLAACVGCLLYFLVFFAHITLLPRQHLLSPIVVGIFCLWSPLAYGLGASYIVQYELQQVGAQWSNIATNAIPEDALSIQAVMVMMFVDTVLYMILVWYIEGVWPGRYGVGKPFYFPFQPSYWLDQKTMTGIRAYFSGSKTKSLDIEGVELLDGGGRRRMTESEERAVEEGGTARMFEDEPTNLPLGISIYRLSKTYTSGLPLKRKKVKAVRNLSLNFYEGQITAFLGHNGAGKTTTMSVLTGLYEPTSGTAQVYGQDIRSNMDDIRHSLGLCPQHNILFDLLTVKEHLLFYGMMRGLSYQHISSTIPSWLSKVGLLAHADKMSMHLSGGMKRKLSVLLAFVGESQTIILDEPTSGVDPFARRQIWDFLLRHRDNRTVMLSTHHMDEAEILGDRIAILSQGSLICSGSFEFLRHNYGKGHRLSLVTHPHSTLLSSSSAAVRSSSNQREEEGQEETDSGAPTVSSTVDSTVLVSRLIQNLIPSARMEEHRGREMRFILPLHQARPQTLKLLFSQLETRANEVGVASYGLTACSMEEIFVQLTHKEVAVAPDDSSSSMVPRPSLHSISLDDTTSLDSRSSDRGSDTRETTVTLGDEEEEGADDVDSVFQLLPNNESIGEQEEEEELEEGKRVVGGYGNEGYQGPHLKGPQLWLTQAAALLLKRLQYTYRRSLATAVQTILPLFLIILGLGIANQLQDVPDQQPLELTPSLFFKVSPENYMFTGGCDDDERWNYTSSFSLPLSYLDYLSSTANTTTSSSSSQYIDPDLELPFSLPNSTFFQLTSPAPAEYLSSLFQPCGIGASESDSDVCGVMMGEGEGVCQVVPGLRCSSVCGECSVFDSNSSLFPVEPPFCFDGSVSRTKIQSVSMKCEDSLDGQEEANLRLISYLLGSKADFIEVRYGGVSFGHVRSEVNESLDAWNTVEGDDWPFLATRQAAKAWYSFKGYHALPAYVNTLSNAILRGHMPANVSTGPIGVQTFSHPFKYSELKRIFYAVTERRTFLVNPLAAIFNLGFIAASFVLFLIEERSGKTFHLQLVCGMSRVVYWLTTALWDLLTYLAFIFLVIMLYIFFQDQYFSDPAILPTVVLLLISFGAAVTPWMYLLSFLFRSPATAYIALFCLNFFSGFSLLIVDAIIVYINGLSMGTNFIIPHLLALPFPSYPLARSLLYASLDRPLKRVALVYEGKQLPHPLQDLWPFLLSLWIQAVVYVAIMIVVQFCPNFITPKCRRPVNIPEVGCDDENVEREERKVRQTNQTNGDILTLRGLTKVYNQCSLRDNSRVAVNRLDLSMKPSECFGLLGVNGAGKTTTFRMLTGDTSPTLGDALILGRSVQERSVVQKAVGYCPQVDALIDQLTGRQHLTLYSRLRGVPRAKVSGVVEWALQRLDLMQHADKPAGQYSGGNRRRLSAAIALLGSPQLLLLDEPTSGVDPAARQFLWSVIRSVASSGQSVLLTTHSMAECEALCSRVGIMVNGTFRCLGTPQQLKSGYGDGYRLKLRVRGELDPIQQFITRHFPNSTLKEKHLNTLIYQLPLAGLKLSEAFRDLEKGRETLEIRDYSLSQTTLDDVFIHFASQQSEGPCEMEEEEERKVDGKEKKGISHLFSQRVNHSNGSVRYTVVRDDVTIT